MALTACSCNYFELAQSPIVFDPGVLVGIGDVAPPATLTVVAPSTTSLAGTAMSGTLLVTAGTLGTGVGSTLPLASIGAKTANNEALGIRAYRVKSGSDWETTAITLGMDVDDTVNAGAFVTLQSVPAAVGIGTTAPQYAADVFGGGGWLLKVGQDNTLQNLRLSLNAVGSYANSAPAALALNPDGGNVGVGTDTPGYPLDVAGTIRTSTGLIAGGAILLPIAAVAGLMDSSGTRRVADENGCYYAS